MKFYSQTLSDNLVWEGYSFGDRKIVIQQISPTAIGFVPIPGIVICGNNLYIKTSHIFEPCNRQAAEMISHHLRAALETYSLNQHTVQLRTEAV